MLRRLFAVLMAILLVGSSNNFVGAKGEIQVVKYKQETTLYSSMLTKDEIFKKGTDALSGLGYDLEWCSITDRPLSLEQKIIEAELTVRTSDLERNVYTADYCKRLFFNGQLPDSFVDHLNKQRFETYVKELKKTETGHTEGDQATMTQVIIEVKDIPLADNYKTMVCQWIDEICLAQGFNNPALIKAMVQCESSFNPNSISSAGCEGLMQITPRYFGALMKKYVVTDLCKDPYGNLQIGIDWVKTLTEKYNGDLGKVLVAYNLGESKVDDHGICSTGYSEKVLRIVGDYM